MNPLWMILASFAGLVVLSGTFALQAAARRRRAARRRAAREAGRLPSMEAVAGELAVPPAGAASTAHSPHWSGRTPSEPERRL
ncbi:MAG: hypothetical protein QM695_12440 [Micropruina sp.]